MCGRRPASFGSARSRRFVGADAIDFQLRSRRKTKRKAASSLATYATGGSCLPRDCNEIPLEGVQKAWQFRY